MEFGMDAYIPLEAMLTVRTPSCAMQSNSATTELGFGALGLYLSH